MTESAFQPVPLSVAAHKPAFLKEEDETKTKTKETGTGKIPRRFVEDSILRSSSSSFPVVCVLARDVLLKNAEQQGNLHFLYFLFLFFQFNFAPSLLQLSAKLSHILMKITTDFLSLQVKSAGQLKGKAKTTLHPGSRRAKQVERVGLREQRIGKQKHDHRKLEMSKGFLPLPRIEIAPIFLTYIPASVDRLLFFVHRLPPEQSHCSLEELHEFLADFLARNDDTIEVWSFLSSFQDRQID
jgi:hypothetical protein